MTRPSDTVIESAPPKEPNSVPTINGTTTPQAELRALIEAARTWAESDAGNRAVESSLREASAMTAELDKVRRIDLKRLDEPYTV